jgi:hypothetical protein
LGLKRPHVTSHMSKSMSNASSIKP